MNHLQSSIRPGPDDILIDKVGIGSSVVYIARNGMMRQGRTEFPATVLKQHPDDGSVDLIVLFEAEDMIWEQRVMPWSELRPNHCWKPVEHMPVDPELLLWEDELAELRLRMESGEHLTKLTIDEMRTQIFGDFEAPPKSVMEHIADFHERLTALEGLLARKR